MKYLKFIILFGAFGLAACQKTPVVIEYQSVCQPENNGKYVTVNGYFDVDDFTICRDRNNSGRIACLMRLREKAGDAKSFGAFIDEGGGANQMEELKRDFQLEDIKIHANDGALIALSDRVKVTGGIEITPLKSQPGTNACSIAVEKIEKAQ